MKKFALFRIGGEEFGIDIRDIVEILKTQKIYSIPQLPDFLSGVINIRGKVIPLLDLGKRLGLSHSEGKGYVILVRTDVERIGLQVDEVTEIIGFLPEELLDPPHIFRGLRTEYLTGLGKRGDRVVILLNLDMLLTAEEKITLKKQEKDLQPIKSS